MPTQEDIFAIQPYSDDEDDGPAIKKEYGHSLKFSLKGVVDKSPKKNKEYVKNYSNKKYGKEKGHGDVQFIGSNTGVNKSEGIQFHRNREPVTASLTDGVWPVAQAEALKHNRFYEVPVKTDSRMLRDKMKNCRVDDIGKEGVKSNNTKGPKLVIHLGGRNKSVASSPHSDASNSFSEKVLNTPNGMSPFHIPFKVFCNNINANVLFLGPIHFGH